MANTPSQILIGSSDDAAYVRNKLIEFNAKHVPNGRYEEVNLCLKNDKGEIIAGLNSAVCWNWMEIDILWIQEDNRGKGLGKQLLEEAEQIARAKDCTFIKLNTFSFQAPEFYKKYGYQVIGIIENAPAGNKHYYYKKDLN
ncbi:N-acetyltransferase [Paenibacillus sp. CF384]|uniref:GNAT family N-acetyltransferase n=1 Tax=Paenibacillus sp. CF384 TaxID=1884382 RepID=UPI000B816E7A|nr:GNAT family N-acetyltransferase [Paenibacillus sp. CF384]